MSHEMNWFFWSLLCLFSLAMGSFLNVIIYRLPKMLQATWHTGCEQLPHFNLFLPRSRCQACQKTIPWWHNIPLVSFILLKGRCCFCQTQISWEYPIIELLTLLFSLLAAQQFGFNTKLLYVLGFIYFIICLTSIDFKHQLLPDSLTQGLLWLGLFANLNTHFAILSDAILGAIAGYAILWLVTKLFYLWTKKIGMGHGDFKLLAALGAWFGWTSLPFILLIASSIGAISGVIYLKITRQTKETPIPFGPFLCLAGLCNLFFPKMIYSFMILQ